MPYIPTHRRIQLKNKDDYPRDEGDLAYHLTQDYLSWLDTQGEWRFKHFARLVGTVVLSLFEFWWRVVRPYEDRKKKLNGDVY